MDLRDAYRDRRTWLIEVADIANLRLKIYGMVGKGKAIRPTTISKAKSHIAESVAVENSKYGFIVLHHGESAVWLLVHWWIEDILYRRLFCAPVNDAESFGDPPGDELACVWELQVIAHERDAWVKHTMMDPENADYEAYLADALFID